MAKYKFNRPVKKDGTLTDYAEMLLDIKENGGIEIVETRRRMKYMTYQHMFEFGLIDSVKQHGTRRHNYVLTQSGLDLVHQINITTLIKPMLKKPTVSISDVRLQYSKIKHLKEQLLLEEKKLEQLMAEV